MSLWKKGIERSITGAYRLEEYDIPLREFCEKLKHKLSSKTKNSIYGCMDITYVITDNLVHWFMNYHYISFSISQIQSNQHMLKLMTESLCTNDTNFSSPEAKMFLYGIFLHLSYEDIINQPI